VDDLLTDFIAETRETLEALAGEIVAWEADPADKTRLDAIFRFVHTVKGSCGFLDLPRLGKLSHAAEDCLAEVRSGTRTPDAALVSAVLAIIDRIGELTDALEANETLPEGEDEFLVAALAPGHAAPAADNPAAISKISVMPGNPVTRTVSRSIRLPVELLDRMMAGVSDMVLARNELSRLLRASGGNSTTDLDISQVIYPSSGYLSKKGMIVGYYQIGAEAGVTGARSHSERETIALTQGAVIHPQYPQEFETSFSVSWHRVPWTRGGWASWSADGRKTTYAAMVKGDRRMYFAGDHMTYLIGWMNGALESDRSVASAIHARAAQERTVAVS